MKLRVRHNPVRFRLGQSEARHLEEWQCPDRVGMKAVVLLPRDKTRDNPLAKLLSC